MGVDEIAGKFEVGMEVSMGRVAGPAASDRVLLGRQVLHASSHNYVQSVHTPDIRKFSLQDASDFVSQIGL